jgi:hypothetical protein
LPLLAKVNRNLLNQVFQVPTGNGSSTAVEARLITLNVGANEPFAATAAVRLRRGAPRTSSQDLIDLGQLFPAYRLRSQAQQLPIEDRQERT